ncbi:tRNA (adenosine(37)-N6)-threonylcarbamoyltransferase complex ATPase subunit type 1 TsaE [Blastochloris tepida]|uniref:tRNA threonylcarbamoyladenosine biosynthesis protein TsaE n=1 Tax=Blastochloris tepida TaxID=2233851 RepID=A0A348G4L6_9HYPH|nr:tRNA (adenosine(37)-N6)-threonylcarbamoyltransferase complex ATPase subunit type 1 TsaE [Blastochloris tepida]BBF94499.1 bifunctional tRNA (adenosine(37)-N6)-threonylcarbamoyltransferase complex ATPase subunit type 1 TsaE/phosphotransferase [Blastochloris tepida]
MTDVPAGSAWDVELPDERATLRLARDLAAALRPGDLVTLAGDLGAGKSTLARAVIRTLAGDETLEVPSPTYTLMQIYDHLPVPVVHADLYRVRSADELEEIGFEEAAEGAAVLVEWPERAASVLAADRLEIVMALAPSRGPDARHARLVGHGAFAARLKRMREIRVFLHGAGWGDAVRRPLAGDASSRRYERLSEPGRHAVLMDAPARPDGPPVRGGLPYSRVAHLAETVTPFVAMARALRERGLSAPDILAADLTKGLLIVEDLGDGRVVEGAPPQPIVARYRAAIELLAALHATPLPPRVPVAVRLDHVLPRYDFDAFLIEVELLIDWYLPFRAVALEPGEREAFTALWRDALGAVIGAADDESTNDEAAKSDSAKPDTTKSGMTKPGMTKSEMTWVLRDFHSPNLIWLEGREGLARVGVIDFQDAVIGPAAYDVASLAQDARVDVAEDVELALLGHYVALRRRGDSAFDAKRFARDYAVLGAQRATKILGIFARLAKRDGKPLYLAHMPRVARYLGRCLAHPDLAPLKAWYAAHVPLDDLPLDGLPGGAAR